jgi:hypothetical protein
MPGNLDVKSLMKEFENRTEQVEEQLQKKFSSTDESIFNNIKIIIDKWDPYRLGHFPVREYETEVWNVFQLIKEGGNTDDIEEYLTFEYEKYPIDSMNEYEKQDFLKTCKQKAQEIFELVK